MIRPVTDRAGEAMKIFAKAAVAKIRLLGLGLTLFLPFQHAAALDSQQQTASTSVTVTNPATKPVPERDIDNPARQPFQYTLSPSSGTSSSATASYKVPAGKHLVIEYYSAQLTQYPSGGYAYMYLTTTAHGNTAYYKVIPPSASTAPLNQLTRIYADPGSTVAAQVVQSSGSSSGGSLILSGYFVNAP
jgi:hypothetical protein